MTVGAIEDYIRHVSQREDGWSQDPEQVRKGSELAEAADREFMEKFPGLATRLGRNRS